MLATAGIAPFKATGAPIGPPPRIENCTVPGAENVPPFAAETVAVSVVGAPTLAVFAAATVVVVEPGLIAERYDDDWLPSDAWAYTYQTVAELGAHGYRYWNALPTHFWNVA